VEELCPGVDLSLHARVHPCDHYTYVPNIHVLVASRGVREGASYSCLAKEDVVRVHLTHGAVLGAYAKALGDLVVFASRLARSWARGCRRRDFDRWRSDVRWLKGAAPPLPYECVDVKSVPPGELRSVLRYMRRAQMASLTGLRRDGGEVVLRFGKFGKPDVTSRMSVLSSCGGSSARTAGSPALARAARRLRRQATSAARGARVLASAITP